MTSPEVVEDLDSGDVETDEPRRVTFDVGKHSFTAVKPKQRTWIMAAELYEDLLRAERAQKRLAGTSRLALDPEEREELETASASAPPAKSLRVTMLTFLEECLVEGDADRMFTLYNDRQERDVDTIPLINAAIALVKRFEKDFVAEAKTLGIRLPEVGDDAATAQPVNRAARRAKKPAAKRATATRRDTK